MALLQLEHTGIQVDTEALSEDSRVLWEFIQSSEQVKPQHLIGLTADMFPDDSPIRKLHVDEAMVYVKYAHGLELFHDIQTLQAEIYASRMGDQSEAVNLLLTDYSAALMNSAYENYVPE